jgi:PIN domain nuclease of toxin-antitoxin system
MRLLLDIYLLLWAAAGTLTEAASYYIEDKSNTLLFSPASIWEVGLRDTPLQINFQRVLKIPTISLLAPQTA